MSSVEYKELLVEHTRKLKEHVVNLQKQVKDVERIELSNDIMLPEALYYHLLRCAECISSGFE